MKLWLKVSLIALILVVLATGACSLIMLIRSGESNLSLAVQNTLTNQQVRAASWSTAMTSELESQYTAVAKRSLARYLMAKFAWSDYERAMLVSLDSRKRVRAAVWLREGTTDRVSLDIKDVVSAAIKGGTDTVVLSHNHPNGAALPSMEDLEATGNIARALGLVNIHLLDHFILTDTEYFSMRDANRLPIYDFKTGTLFWP